MTHICFALVLLLLTAPVAAPEQPQKPKEHAKHDRGATAAPDKPAVSVHVIFSSHDAGVIREYYAPRYRRLPPGLQKKLARGGSLPPGWERKMEYFPPVLEHRLAHLPDGYRRGVIDAHAVIYKSGSPIIIDATVLF